MRNTRRAAALGSTGTGALAPGVTGNYPRDRHLTDHEWSRAEIIGWRTACTCGWQGELWERVTTTAEADLSKSKRRDYCSLGGFFLMLPKKVEDAIGDEWRVHIVPAKAVAGVEAAARKYAAARTSGAPWADIGDAVGITRQAAHERWSTPESGQN